MGRNGPGASSDSHVWTRRSYPMKTLVSRFVKNESGATAIEYGLIAAGISVAIIAVVQGLGRAELSRVRICCGRLRQVRSLFVFCEPHRLGRDNAGRVFF